MPRHPACLSAGSDSPPVISCCGDTSSSYLMLPQVPPHLRYQPSSWAPKGRDRSCLPTHEPAASSWDGDTPARALPLLAKSLPWEQRLPVTQGWRGDQSRRSAETPSLLTVLIPQPKPKWRGRAVAWAPPQPPGSLLLPRILFRRSISSSCWGVAGTGQLFWALPCHVHGATVTDIMPAAALFLHPARAEKISRGSEQAVRPWPTLSRGQRFQQSQPAQRWKRAALDKDKGKKNTSGPAEHPRSLPLPQSKARPEPRSPMSCGASPRCRAGSLTDQMSLDTKATDPAPQKSTGTPSQTLGSCGRLIYGQPQTRAP